MIFRQNPIIFDHLSLLYSALKRPQTLPVWILVAIEQEVIIAAIAENESGTTPCSPPVISNKGRKRRILEASIFSRVSCDVYCSFPRGVIL